MQKNPVAVVASDTHLQEAAWRGRSIRGDAYHSFRQIVDYCLRKRLPLILAGDVLDTHANEPGPIVFLAAELARLFREDLTVYHIQGQHEGDGNNPWMSVAQSSLVTHLHRQRVRLGDLWLYGLDYQSSGKLQEELQRIPKQTDILIAHQGWAEIAGTLLSPQGALSEVPVVSTVVTGDYHKTEILDQLIGADGQPLRAYSPGSTCLQEISEPPEKFFGVLMNDGEVRFRRLKTRTRLEADLRYAEDVESFLDNWTATLEQALLTAAEDGLPEELRKPLLWVRYHDSDFLRRVNKVVKGQVHLFPKRVEKKTTTACVEDEAAPTLAGLTMEKSLELELQSSSPKAYSLAKRIWENRHDPVAELKRWKAEVLAGEGDTDD